MNGRHLLVGMGFVDEKFVDEAECEVIVRKFSRPQYGIVAAACLVMTLLGSLIALQYQIISKDDVGTQDNTENMIAEISTDETGKEINDKPNKVQMSRSTIFVNEITDLADADRRILPDSSMYSEVIWNQEDIVDYYGKDITPNYIPDGLQASQNNCNQRVLIGNDNVPIEDTIWIRFYTEYFDDGSPKPANGLTVCKGSTITASKLGILNDCLYSNPDEQIAPTNISGTDVTICHMDASYGPYDEDTYEPAGYYDEFIVTFKVKDIYYQIISEQIDLDEVTKIVISVITGKGDIELVD